ncbi:MAG: protein-disulfide reductase DsbD domain-containing protein [Candidatus Kapaibacteriales bacterium]
MLYLTLIFIFSCFTFYASFASVKYSDSKIALRLISSHKEISAGDTILCAIEAIMKKGWHIYWINPGDAGEPTKFFITTNINPTDTLTPFYPIPRITNTEGVVTFDYFNEVIFPFKIIIPKNFNKDTLEIYVTAQWLVCREKCITGKTKLNLKFLNAGKSKIIKQNKIVIERSLQKLPVDDLLDVEVAHDNYLFKITFNLPLNKKVKNLFIYPISEGIFDLEARQNFFISENYWTIYLRQAQYIWGDTTRISGIIEFQTQDNKKHYYHFMFNKNFK